MALSDCSGCWDTPCRCGKDYEHWSIRDLKDQIKMLERVLARKEGLDPNRNKPGEWDTSRPGNW